MSGPANDNSGDRAVSILATAFVVTGGCLIVTLIIAISTSDPLRSSLKFFGATAAVLTVVWLLRDKPKKDLLRQRYSGLFRKTKKRKVTVRIGRKATDAQPDSQAKPPTAKQIHELADGINTWVPSGPSPSGEPGSREDEHPDDEWRKIR